MYVCTQLLGNDCLSWQELQALSFVDVRSLLPYVILVLIVAFGFKLVRRFLFS